MPPGRNDFATASVPNPRGAGVLTVIVANPEDLPERAPRNNAATAASAAGVRALSSQLVAFYFRAPAKAFFRTRVDYLAYARTVHNAQTSRLWQAVADDRSASRLSLILRHSWLWMRSTTPGVLTSVIKHQGWGVVPRQILPPLVANVGVGAVLYTSYLQILGRLHPESAKASFLAGGLQSVVAAPLDALQARYDHRDLMPSDGSGRPRSLWTFGAEKLREIGVRGIFAGWALSFAKDSLGSAVFFSTFEYVKAQAYYRFVTWYYGGLGRDIVDVLAIKHPSHRHAEDETIVIRPHYAIEPMFLLCAGISASFTQQLLLHPLTHFQVKHWDHLEDLDQKAARMLRAYYRAYQETWGGCAAEAAAEGQSLGRWLYRGFWWNAIRQVPSTSAGLIIFELIRRKYGFGAEEVRITKDGYDILLS
ncbi:mitochondrial carrier protein [Hirsutella rhossiliensis]|uniref:Mitochondrial carrier protein n=1 Tax=Hirsutella rhossiliensis TaxID=111463 RepID=A0A9P8N0I6_9HYPO|nr:mitochondrial carrier protein [Hirsutella rhossiliensis]KAH0963701.1 mitochondrial carrier protein [Hirsutella rhossiliensis]